MSDERDLAADVASGRAVVVSRKTLTAIKRDAERWRYLRSQSWGEPTAAMVVEVTFPTYTMARPAIECCKNRDWYILVDAALDNALLAAARKRNVPRELALTQLSLFSGGL